MTITRCPACLTTFRVGPEQLALRQGRVRCGHCYRPFDALAHAQPEPDTAEKPAAPAAESPPVSPSTHPFDRSSEASARHSFDRTFAPSVPASEPLPVPEPEPEPEPATLPTLDFDIPEHPSSFRSEGIPPASEPAAFAAPPPEKAPPFGTASTPGSSEPYRSYFPAPGNDAQPEPSPEIPETSAHTAPFSPTAPEAGQTSAADDADDLTEAASPVPAPQVFSSRRQAPEKTQETDTKAATETELAPYGKQTEVATTPPSADEPETETETETNETAETAGSEAPTTVSSPTASASEERNKDADDGELEDWRRKLYDPAPPATPYRALWALGIGVLLGIFAAQASYFYRESITREWPQLRPAYLTACELLACEVPLPRIADHLAIERSNLEVIAGPTPHFELHAIVLNRAPHPQQHPHLELTLTDHKDKPLSRRALAPEEWLATAETDLSAGLQAGERIEVILPFTTPELRGVAGYRLAAFYP